MRRRVARLGLLLAPIIGACGPTTGTGRPAPGTATDPRVPAAWVAKVGAYARPETPDDDFRKLPPAGGTQVGFVPPKIEEKRLANGMRVLWVERHELPIVALSFVSTVGADQGDPGMTDLLVHTMFRGTSTRAGGDLTRTFEELGVTVAVEADYDAAAFGFRMLGHQLGQVTTVAADVLQNATYPTVEVESMRKKRLRAMVRRAGRPATAALWLEHELLFPEGHPYASPVEGTLASLPGITVAELKDHHQLVFDPRRVTVVAAGDIDRVTLIGTLEEKLTGWKGASREPVTRPTVTKAPPRRVVILDRPGDTQVALRVFGLGPRTGSPGRPARSVLSAVLSRRLFDDLRERHGWTYGASASFGHDRLAGTFAAISSVEVDHAGDALREILEEIRKTTVDPVSDEELAFGKVQALARFARGFETVTGTTGLLAGIAASGASIDDFAGAPARISAVTAADVLAAAQASLQASGLSVVAVGDAAKVRPQLEKLALGTLEVRVAGKVTAADDAP